MIDAGQVAEFGAIYEHRTTIVKRHSFTWLEIDRFCLGKVELCTSGTQVLHQPSFNSEVGCGKSTHHLVLRAAFAASFVWALALAG